jgi:hypothetical protein
VKSYGEYDPKVATLVDEVPTALNQAGYRLSPAELAKFNGRPKKVDRLPKMRTGEDRDDDKATASRDRRHAETVHRSDINFAP